MDANTAKSHVNLVAILHIIFGVLGLVGAAITLIALSFAESFIPENEFMALEIIVSIKAIIPTIIAFFSLIGLLAGAALYTYKDSARILVIVISAVNCLNIPIGTAKGVYSIWALMRPEVRALFR